MRLSKSLSNRDQFSSVNDTREKSIIDMKRVGRKRGNTTVGTTRAIVDGGLLGVVITFA